MFMALMLQKSSSVTDMQSADGGPEFATFFIIYWVGALVITINAILLGGSMYVNHLSPTYLTQPSSSPTGVGDRKLKGAERGKAVCMINIDSYVNTNSCTGLTREVT